eukprot:7390960-Prymnesium_polylepis.1
MAVLHAAPPWLAMAVLHAAPPTACNGGFARGAPPRPAMAVLHAAPPHGLQWRFCTRCPPRLAMAACRARARAPRLLHAVAASCLLRLTRARRQLAPSACVRPAR